MFNIPLKKIAFTFPYKLPPGLRKKSPKGIGVQKYPLLPIVLYSKTKKTKVIEALIDSGSDLIHINKQIAEYLQLHQGKEFESSGMGGKYTTYETSVGLIIGRGGREVDFGYVTAMFPKLELDVPILIGRKPVFEEYQIIFEEFKERFKLIPKGEVLKL